MSIDLEACLLVFEIEKERKNFKDHWGLPYSTLSGLSGKLVGAKTLKHCLKPCGPFFCKPNCFVMETKYMEAEVQDEL